VAIVVQDVKVADEHVHLRRFENNNMSIYADLQSCTD
jgi:hypothetical protein